MIIQKKERKTKKKREEEHKEQFGNRIRNRTKYTDLLLIEHHSIDFHDETELKNKKKRRNCPDEREQTVLSPEV